eukprot:scaffold1644_cov357-Prasinococcus_capsulatus_cf.AAC.4
MLLDAADANHIARRDTVHFHKFASHQQKQLTNDDRGDACVFSAQGSSRRRRDMVRRDNVHGLARPQQAGIHPGKANENLLILHLLSEPAAFGICGKLRRRHRKHLGDVCDGLGIYRACTEAPPEHRISRSAWPGRVSSATRSLVVEQVRNLVLGCLVRRRQGIDCHGQDSAGQWEPLHHDGAYAHTLVAVGELPRHHLQVHRGAYSLNSLSILGAQRAVRAPDRIEHQLSEEWLQPRPLRRLPPHDLPSLGLQVVVPPQGLAQGPLAEAQLGRVQGREIADSKAPPIERRAEGDVLPSCSSASRLRKLSSFTSPPSPVPSYAPPSDCREKAAFVSEMNFSDSKVSTIWARATRSVGHAAARR